MHLDYPNYPFKIEKRDGKDCIFDPNRKKWIVLTPEEWVRQHFIQYLIQVKSYPSSLISIEKEFQLGELKKRFDIVVYKDATPWMLIECKEASTNLNEAVIQQLFLYQHVIQATYIIATNGHQTIGAKITSGTLYMIESIPDYHS
jgi:predicted type IV restriction endonuclease